MNSVMSWTQHPTEVTKHLGLKSLRGTAVNLFPFVIVLQNMLFK
jgi:hypothetical protein